MRIFFFLLGAMCVGASDVVTLTYDNFEEQTQSLTGEGGSWLVGFFAPGCEPCEKFTPEWEEMATELKSDGIHVASVDGKLEINGALTHRFRVDRMPAFYFFKDGNIYEAKAPVKGHLLHFAREGYVKAAPHLRGPVPPVVLPEDVPGPIVYPPEHTGPSDVVTLTDENFEHLTQATSGSTTGDWLIEFYAPWCGHCKLLQPVWEEIATEVKDQFVVGKVDIDANKLVAERFQIKSYPTIKFLKQGEMLTFQYKGGREKEDIFEFVREANSRDTIFEPIPKDFTPLDRIQLWLQKHKLYALKRLNFAKRDIAKGKYWTPHTIIVLAVAAAIPLFCVIFFVIFGPSKKPSVVGSKSRDSKKCD